MNLAENAAFAGGMILPPPLTSMVVTRMNKKSERLMDDTSKLIGICGGGEIASAAAIRLFKCGFDVVMFADREENLLRYHLCLGDALFLGQKTVEDIAAAILPEDVLAEQQEKSFADPLLGGIQYLLKDRKIPVLEGAEFERMAPLLAPRAIVNAQAAPEAPIPVSIDHAPLVIGLHPFHQPGVQCHFAVESRLNYFLGRVISAGIHLPEESSPGDFFKDPFAHCQTPMEGLWLSLKAIGDAIRYNEAIGKINDIEIRSPHDGQLWGLAHSGRFLPAKSPVALIYQGKASERYRYLSFRENAIAGGILQAVMQFGE